MPEPPTPYSTNHYVYKYITTPLSKFMCPISPNVITALNMFMIFPVIYIIIFDKPLWTLIGAMVLRQIIDCLDGSIARNCNSKSEYGFFLDITSDLLYHYTLIIALVYRTYTTNLPFPYIRLIILLIIMIYYLFAFLDTIVTKQHKTAMFLQDNSVLILAIVAIIIKTFF